MFQELWLNIHIPQYHFMRIRTIGTLYLSVRKQMFI